MSQTLVFIYPNNKREVLFDNCPEENWFQKLILKISTDIIITHSKQDNTKGNHLPFHAKFLFGIDTMQA